MSSYKLNYKGSEIQTLLNTVNQGVAHKIHTHDLATEETSGFMSPEEKVALQQKFDGAYVEDGYLYLTSNGEIVEGPLGPFGSGGAGGGTDYTIKLENLLDSRVLTVPEGQKVELKFNYSSMDNEGYDDGQGVGSIAVNNIKKLSFSVAQGVNTLDITSYLVAGSNSVRLRVENSEGAAKTITYTITVVVLSLTSSFDSTMAYNGAITFNYEPIGLYEKAVYFIVDGEEVATNVTSVSGVELRQSIGPFSHGDHILECYFTCNIEGEIVSSNVLRFALICVEDGNTTPIIASTFNQTEATQYGNVVINYQVYHPINLSTPITLSGTNMTDINLTVDRKIQQWIYRPMTTGECTLKISCDGTEINKEWTFNVSESAIDVEAVTENLSLFLSSYGRSNNEANPGNWAYKDIECKFQNFNFISDGWQQDEDGTTVLRIGGKARLTIPVKLFGQDFRTSGKTIEIEFSTRDVYNYDAVIFSCLNANRGLQITAQKAFLRTEQSEVTTQYKEEEHIRLTFVTEKRSSVSKLLMCYINGILSSVVQYPELDDFTQASPVEITIGSDESTIDLYCIRVYDNDLTRRQVLNNWIADTQNINDMVDRYNRNQIYDTYGQIVISQLPSNLPYLVLDGPVLPQSKGDKQIISGTYTDPVNPENNFTFSGAQIDVQGTSSQYYARKNYKIKFKNGFFLSDGTSSELYVMNSQAIPTDTFTFKADVASSEGANNVELVRLYNDICPYKTPPQLEDPRVRQGIDGFPIVIFWNNGTTVQFMGKYNFNNDKGTPEVFGMDDNDESWEIKNNDPGRALWQNADFSTNDWKNDFEARHPEDNEDTTKLSALARWLVSTDQAQATNVALTAPVVYEGTEYTIDDANYRLAKFKAELEDWFDKDAIIFNYLFTELFLLTDSRAKNAFPTIYDDTKWTILPYDMDTALGIDNLGKLSFGYELEDIDKTGNGENVFNGQDSVLYVNLRQGFYEDIKAMYQQLRKDGKLSYEDTQRRFIEHQSKWPEAIFNEDAYFKYLAPLIESGGTNTQYLEMLLGSKSEQRKWWLYNRYRYIDSKYNAKGATEDIINWRSYNRPDTISVRTYADIYFSMQFGSRTETTRTFRNQTYNVTVPRPEGESGGGEANEAETYIYTASQIADLGDLSQFYIGRADFTMATRLQSLKIGDSSKDYNNTNLSSLALGNNGLLKVLDVRNCSSLKGEIKATGCTGLEEVYFDGTAITGLSLPNGGVLKTLHLPGTLASLIVQNQTFLEDFYMPDYSNITTLHIENAGSVIPVDEILAQMASGGRVRLIGIERQLTSEDALVAFAEKINTMRGIDEAGNNLETAVVTGSMHIPNVSPTGLYYIDMLAEKYPLLTITYDSTKNYTVEFYQGDVLLQTVEVTTYGTSAVYTGETPVYPGLDPENWRFRNWDPSPKVVTSDLKCKAVFGYVNLTHLKLVERTLSGDYTNDTVTHIGYCAFGECPIDTLTLNAAETGDNYILSPETYATYSQIKHFYAPKLRTVITAALRSSHNLITATLPVLDRAQPAASQLILGCGKLEKLDTGETKFGYMDFSGCYSLSTLILRSELVAIFNTGSTSTNFTDTLIAQGKGNIYVPSALVEDYKSATGWSEYGDYILAIEDYPEITGG